MSEPHSGECARCGEPVIEARLAGSGGRTIVLDPAQESDGAYRAHIGPLDQWMAWRVTPDDEFRGSRRRLHVCWRGRQLVIGEEAEA